jgi:hypothetical protein
MKRVRPVGSNSFVRVRISDLVKVSGSNAIIPVSRVWLRENNIEVAQLVQNNVAAIPKESSEEKIEFSLTTF